MRGGMEKGEIARHWQRERGKKEKQKEQGIISG